MKKIRLIKITTVITAFAMLNGCGERSSNTKAASESSASIQTQVRTETQHSLSIPIEVFKSRYNAAIAKSGVPELLPINQLEIELGEANFYSMVKVSDNTFIALEYDLTKHNVVSLNVMTDSRTERRAVSLAVLMAVTEVCNPDVLIEARSQAITALIKTAEESGKPADTDIGQVHYILEIDRSDRMNFIVESVGRKEMVEEMLSKPTQFNTVVDALTEFNKPSDGPLPVAVKVLNQSPLHIELLALRSSYRTGMTPDEQDLYESGTKRVLIHGVYRSFIHTPVDRITVTTKPYVLDVTKKEFSDPGGTAFTVSITRQQALDLIRQHLGVKGFEDLVVNKEVNGEMQRDQMSVAFESILFNFPDGEGRDAFWEKFFKYSVR